VLVLTVGYIYPITNESLSGDNYKYQAFRVWSGRYTQRTLFSVGVPF